MGKTFIFRLWLSNVIKVQPHSLYSCKTLQQWRQNIEMLEMCVNVPESPKDIIKTKITLRGKHQEKDVVEHIL